MVTEAMEIRIFKVQGVDASVGQMRLKVWVRMSWLLGLCSECQYLPSPATSPEKRFVEFRESTG